MPSAFCHTPPDVCPCRVAAPLGKRPLPSADHALVSPTVANRYFPGLAARRRPREQTPS